MIAGGGGGVGASAAFNLLLLAGGHDVVLLDRRPEMVTSHGMDLEQALEQGAAGSVPGGNVLDRPGVGVGGRHQPRRPALHVGPAAIGKSTAA